MLVKYYEGKDVMLKQENEDTMNDCLEMKLQCLCKQFNVITSIIQNLVNV